MKRPQIGGCAAPRFWARPLMAMIASAAMVDCAAAQEYCVRCEAPVAVYRCIIENGSPQGMTLKAMCVAMMARDGKHAACRVAGGTVFDCDGPKRRIDARLAGPLLIKGEPLPAQPGPVAPSAATVPTAGEKSSPSPFPVAPAGQATAPPDKSPSGKAADDATPKTVEQLAKQAGKSTGRMMDDMGHGADKAWRCISSLFKDC